MFADFDNEKCISLIKYVMRLFPTAAMAIISKACSPENNYTRHKLSKYMNKQIQ